MMIRTFHHSTLGLALNCWRLCNINKQRFESCKTHAYHTRHVVEVGEHVCTRLAAMYRSPVLGGLGAGRGGHGAQADGPERAQRRRQRRGPPLARVLLQRRAAAELQRVAPRRRRAACNNIPPRSTLRSTLCSPLVRSGSSRLAQLCTTAYVQIWTTTAFHSYLQDIMFIREQKNERSLSNYELKLFIWLSSTRPVFFRLLLYYFYDYLWSFQTSKVKSMQF